MHVCLCTTTCMATLKEARSHWMYLGQELKELGASMWMLGINTVL